MSQFPKDFLWGTATAAYQIEGSVRADGKGWSNWDEFTHRHGTIFRGDTGDIADDHYNRVEEDLDLMAQLGVNSYRFSVPWTRIQANGTGPVNRRGIDHYDRLIDGLLERGIAPMLTTFHYDLPQELELLDGWGNRDIAFLYADYASELFEAYADRVKHWITINEPWYSAWMGYAMGSHAPGRRDIAAASRATHHLLLGHGLAVQRFREIAPDDAQIGITLCLQPTVPASDSAEDAEAAVRIDAHCNRLFLDPLFGKGYPEEIPPLYPEFAADDLIREGDMETIATPADFLGINYYLRYLAQASDGEGDMTDPTDAPYPGLFARTVRKYGAGLIMQPDGLTETLLRIRDEYADIPIHITENGKFLHDYVDPQGDVNDFDRIRFYSAHIEAVADAMAQGVDVRGFQAWSLMDNFEWESGYFKRYGIVYVDFETQRRIPKASYWWYRDVIAAGGLR